MCCEIGVDLTCPLAANEETVLTMIKTLLLRTRWSEKTTQRFLTLFHLSLSLPHLSVFLPLSFVSLSLISSLLSPSLPPSLSISSLALSVLLHFLSLSVSFHFVSPSVSLHFISHLLSLFRFLSIHPPSLWIIIISITQSSSSRSLCLFVHTLSCPALATNEAFMPFSLLPHFHSLSLVPAISLSLSPTVSTRPFAPLQLQSQEGEREEWERHK